MRTITLSAMAVASGLYLAYHLLSVINHVSMQIARVL